MTFEQEPPRGPRPVLQRTRRGALAPTLIVVGLLIVLGLVFSQLWTDVLWYRELDFLQVFRTEILTRSLLFLLGAAVMGGGVGASLMIGYRSRPIYAPVSVEQAGLDRYRESIEPLRKLVVIAVPAGLALFAGSAASQQWSTLLLWWNRVPFGTKDPQFNMDIGFFVFTLPWLQFLVGFLSTVVFLSTLAGLATHYLYGGLRLQGTGPRVTQAARIHLALLVALFIALRGVDYWLDRWALSTKQSARITGLSYTDANAVLTSKALLAVIAILVALLFVGAAFTSRARYVPLYGVALLVVSALVIGGIYPLIVQRFQVRPTEQSLEEPFIQRNIDATRAAYGLDAIQVTNFQAETEATPGALRNDADTVPGIRLLDPSVVSPAFRQLEQNKQYYSFPDSLDVDRYTIDDKSRDTVIAVRELDLGSVPAGQRNWYNDHLVYTHGFGVVAAYGNERRADGAPSFYESGIPSTGALGKYEPRVYFGESSPNYSIVGGTEDGPKRELDYPDDNSANGQQNNTYNGQGGVSIGSTFNKLLYAIKFREGNILLSNAINNDSKILYDRTPRERVEKVAPFLTLDGDPYPAVVDGKITWILDGYTTTNEYPYSRTQVLRQATSDSVTASSESVVPLADQRVNYMRNSVKATVDAYTGKVTLYTWDEQDPILKAWRKVFPDAVQPLSAISGDLMSHLRYPEDLLKVQRTLLQNYHVTDAAAYFGGQDFWRVPTDPAPGTANQQLQPPYYLTLQMPGQDTPSFSLTSSFIPAGGTRNVLTGYLSVDADAGSEKGKRAEGYGTMRLLQLPRDSVVPGPGQVQNTFNANPTVSQALNLLRQGDSVVQRGNLLTLPVGGGLLYVQPVYVRSSGDTSYPLLQKVLVAFGDRGIGFADTLDQALDQVFGGNSGASGGDADIADGTDDTPPATGTGGGSGSADNAAVRAALQDASDALKAGQDALKANDFAAYGVAQKNLDAALKRAIEAEAEASATATASPSATPSATPSASATP